MLEIKEEDATEIRDDEQKRVSLESQNTPHKASHESLFGALLFLCMLVFVLMSIASIVWVVYKGWQKNRIIENEPSIAVLSEKTSDQSSVTEVPKEETIKNEAQQSPENTPPLDSASLKKTVISVLNGGGTKGSAGVIATFLKSERYINVTAGNAIKDYTGVTVYFSDGMDKEAEAIKLVLIKKYPAVKMLKADAVNKETSISKITIIIGK
ncbi:MAG: LytR C-terminal domain-containing protein [Candidatus Moranbacteria bacterium]|nr:LytR C-terminal domain-containing protein [Candidatus Moranbacteria bacterium]OIQ02048.1 MAG: hypothetical protein AUK58_03585 [Candidatus Moranbacteria bacterium CG2_30_41_165]PIP25562.1 MAG: hypothetical protein COX32_02725 [Candidatus Moranbacteria bacterium CG23_combo_of_CG06-09_8_20_14_all_41_28]PIV86472.1 MAG: hypothetical protein COW50_01220 [Candidatus Moranbacteria bacterium CG17_big_fil_post_rev_8_21_14_2_50_41_107]PIW94545.1 MAG: hypothetical protein COZ86_00470 [Candidatus Moranb